MEYEVLFDIHSTSPQFPFGIVVILIIAFGFVLARWRPQILQSVLDRYWIAIPAIKVESFPTAIGFLVSMIVPSVIGLIQVLARMWVVPLIFGLSFIGLSGWGYFNDRSEINALQHNPNTEQLVGTLADTDHFLTLETSRKTRHIWHETFTVNQHRFTYSELQPATPYPLLFQTRPFANGQHVRITYIGDNIVKVERQLCLAQSPCAVRYVGDLRIESAL